MTCFFFSDVMSSTVGFAVGSSTAAPAMHKGSRFVQRAESDGKTEGVWVSAIEAEGDKDNLVYLVLDFEGIGSVGSVICAPYYLELLTKRKLNLQCRYSWK